MTAQHFRLMIPGPVDAEDDVLQAMAAPILPHYGKEWMEIYDEVLERLKQLFGTQNDLILMTGPGTAALDAALGSLMRTGEKVLVPSNGFFGKRLGTLALGYGLDVCTGEAHGQSGLHRICPAVLGRPRCIPPAAGLRRTASRGGGLISPTPDAGRPGSTPQRGGALA